MPGNGPLSLFYTLLRWLPRAPRLHWVAARLVNDSFLAGVLGVIWNERREVLLFSHTYRSMPWSLPGGWMQCGESPLVAIEREVREESGLAVRAERLLLVGTTTDRPKLEFVVAAGLVGGTFRPSREVDAMQWCALDRLPPIASVHRRILRDVEQLPAGQVGSYSNLW